MKVTKSVTCEVDDKIAESIIKLNNKGYETAMSCSGHPDEEEIIPYVMFNRFVSCRIEYIPFIIFLSDLPQTLQYIPIILIPSIFYLLLLLNFLLAYF